ncbi:MAG: MFS transporter [Pauljensenia sp.]
MTATRPAPSVAARRARGAVFALFFTNGALFANLVPRYPEVKDTFNLSDPAYGATIALFPLGAVCAGPLAAWVIRRFSSARTATLGTISIGVALSLVGMVTVWRASIDEGTPGSATLAYALFAVTFFLGGASDSITDVGQNAHGLRVQRLYGRSIINSFHGGWSLGAVTGGLMGSLAVGLGIPLGWHLLGAAVIFIVVGAIALRFALPGADVPGSPGMPVEAPEGVTTGQTGLTPAATPGAGDAPVYIEEGHVSTMRWPWMMVIIALTVLAISGTAVEDITSTWSTLYMRDFLEVREGFAGLAFVTMLVSQTVGRLGGDRVIDALGMRRTIQLGGALVLVGTGLAAAVPAVWTMLVGMVLAGLGCAAVVPVAMNAADDIPGMRAGVGLTIVTWLMRLSFLLGPPLVGLMVEATTLRSAVMVMPIAGAVTLIAAAVLAPSPRGGSGSGAARE